MMKPRQLTCSYTIANLESISALTDTEISAQEVETSEGDTKPDVPVKGKHGRLVGSKNKLNRAPAPRKAKLADADADADADMSLEKPPIEKKRLSLLKPCQLNKNELLTQELQTRNGHDGAE
jgi:hypothetical protein